MNPVGPLAIDITRPFDILATCPECGLQRELPENWRYLVGKMPPDWDGELRCRRHAMPVVMRLDERRHPKIEPDGSVVVHLVMDSDLCRAACTEELWAGLPANLPAGTTLRQCQACHVAAKRLAR